MKIFLDSAELDEIKNATDAGINGVTTNPSLLKKAVDKRRKKGEKIDITRYIKQILQTAKDRPVSLEVIEGDWKELSRQAIILWKTFRKYGNVVIKIPINPSLEEEFSFDGVKAIKYLTEKRIPVNVTLVMSPVQALMAAKAGAKYVSPFAGRIDDYLREKAEIKFQKEDYYPKEGLMMKGKLLEDDIGIFSGVELLRSTVQIFRNYGIKAKVLASSLRNPRQVKEVAEIGADVATLPFDVLKKLFYHPKTFEGMKKFVEDTPKEYKNLFK